MLWYNEIGDNMKVIISAGGTGGHIYPALAIIEKIKKEDKKAEFLYIGTTNRMEKDIIPEKGIKYEAIEIYGFNKKRVLTNIKNLYLIAKAFVFHQFCFLTILYSS